MTRKPCYIADVVPVRVPPSTRKKLGPIGPTLLTDGQIFSILNSVNPPTHFYALDPNDNSRKVLLTKQNYTKTVEELFGSKDEPTVVKTEEPAAAAPVVEEPAPVVESPVEAPVDEVPETEESVVDDAAASEGEAVVETTDENESEVNESSSSDMNGDRPYRSKRNRDRRRN